MVEDDINQMFPSNKVGSPVIASRSILKTRAPQVWDEVTRSWVFRAPAPTSMEKVAVNPSRSFFVPGTALFPFAFHAHASHTQTLHLHLPHLQRVRPSVNLFRSLPPHRSQRTAPRIHQTLSRQKARVYQQQKHERRAACRGRGAAEHVH
jgi:hypothetical protein